MTRRIIEKFNVKFVYDSNITGGKLSCDLCDHILTSVDDIALGEQFGVCYLCHLKIVQPNIQRWDAGWRPAKISEERILPDLSFVEDDN